MSEVKNIPKHWQVKKLGEVCNFVGGGTPSKNVAEYWQGNLCWASIKDIKGQYLFKTIDFISEEGAKNSATNIAYPNEIILATRINPGRPIISKIKTAINQDLKIVKPKETISIMFLYYTFLNIERKIIKESKGTTVLGTTLNILNDIHIPIPPLPEQQRIVSRIEELLSDLENGKQQLLTAQQQLKVYRQSLLKAAFEGKLTNKEVKEGELPKGWKWVKLGDATNKKSKKVLPNDYPNANFIGMDCIEPHSLKPSFTYKFKEFKSAGNYFETGQVLYGRMRPYLNKVYKAEYDGTCSGEFIILECKEILYPDFLKYILHSREFVNFANHKTSGDRPRISFDEIADYQIALGSYSEQLLIVSELESKLTVCDHIEETIRQSLQQAETLRQSILKKAFEGRLVKI